MHTLLMNLLLLLTGFFIYRVCRIVARVTKHQPAAQQWRDNLRFIGIIMTVCLLANAMAYGKGALILWHMEEEPTMGSLVRTQASVLLGTASLMWLVGAGLADPSILQESTPQRGMYRAMTVIVEQLLFRFWWAAIGFGIVFGVADRGATLLLAIELTFCWAMGQALLRWNPSE
ncbi:MAG: hypothetical protein QNJ46_17195 [Leptolyngbyaceae cyanobacterium MO_188.B28]|nr:hypothetical protein [Leptolyngbyaceae cyanobacterium MO_188.B28]